MGEVKLSIESDSMKELMEDIISSLEELGAMVIKSSGDIPEGLDEILKTKGIFLYHPEDGIPEGLLKAMVERDQEDVLDFLLDNEESFTRIIEMLEEKGISVTKPGSKTDEDDE